MGERVGARGHNGPTRRHGTVFAESADVVCDFLRGLERKEVTGTCNLDAGGIGEPGHDLGCDDGGRDDGSALPPKTRTGQATRSA